MGDSHPLARETRFPDISLGESFFFLQEHLLLQDKRNAFVMTETAATRSGACWRCNFSSSFYWEGLKHHHYSQGVTKRLEREAGACRESTHDTNGAQALVSLAPFCLPSEHEEHSAGEHCVLQATILPNHPVT